jgi:hypothetical protein
MAGHSKLPRVSALQLLGALCFLFFGLDTHAVTVSPSPSYDGNYTVSWGTTLGYSWVDEYPCYPEYWYSLQEDGVDVAWSGYSLPISGRPAGPHTYYVYFRSNVCGAPYDEGIVEGPVSVTVGAPPSRDPMSTQLTYQYETRAGDIDWDGKTDIFVRRTSGGVTGNGTLEQVILQQSSAGGTFSILVPDYYQAATASTWPGSGASVVVSDFNVDGYADVEVKGVAGATGAAGAFDQIVYSPAAPYSTQPLGLRAVDASLKQFVGNSLDYFSNPNYFTDNATPVYVSAWVTYFYCWPTFSGMLSDYYYGSWYCVVYYNYYSGYYWDYTAFSDEAVALWSNDEGLQADRIDETESTEGAQEAAEEALEVEIGGWPMEEEFGSEGEHTDSDIRRGLETFWAILGIGRANAQEVETDEAPPQTARLFDVVYITGHPVFGFLPTHSALEYTSASTATTTISAAPYPAPMVGPFLRSDINRPSDRYNMVLGTVIDPGNPIPALYWAELIEADSRYDDQLGYHPSNPGGSLYNSNGYTNGLIIATGGNPSINMNRLVGASHPVPASEFQ